MRMDFGQGGLWGERKDVKNESALGTTESPAQVSREDQGKLHFAHLTADPRLQSGTEQGRGQLQESQV